MPGVDGICLSIMFGSQIVCHNSFLKLEEKAPIYETNSLASNTSPITLLILAFKNSTFSLQRLFYPAKPLTSFSAAINLFEHLSASSSTNLFCYSAAANFYLRASTFSFNFLTYSFTLASYFIAVSSYSVALSLASCSGRTFL